jgi:hypothetical protein
MPAANEPFKPRFRPTQDDDASAEKDRARYGSIADESREVRKDIADADKKARTGSEHEDVRNTPPAGHWNETAPD